MGDKSFSIHWISLPPFVAILTVLVVGFFSSGPPAPVDESVWGLVGLLFAVLTVIYGIFIRLDFYRGFFPVQLIAQGLLLCPLSLRMGARMFPWVGVTMAVCGSVVLVVVYWQSRSELLSQLAMLPLPELPELPLPFALTEKNGKILFASEFLLRLTNQSREEAMEKEIGVLLPLDKEVFELGGKKWRVLHTVMQETQEMNAFPLIKELPFAKDVLSDGGSMYFFQLEQVRNEPKTSSFTDGEGDFIDSATTLYTRSFASRHAEEELYRIRRYHRTMSAALLRVVFLGTNDPSKEEEIFNAYCRFIRANTRETDISCLVGPRDVLVMMLETPIEGAKEVLSKLLDFVSHIERQLEGFDGAVEIRDGIAFFNEASGDLSFDQVLEKLNESLGGRV